MNNASPKAAYAWTGKINGVEFQLLRHHCLSSVRDGTEHDTVDHILLTLALRSVDQLPIEGEEREKIRQHLQTHASWQSADKESTEEVAKLGVRQQDGGEPTNDPLGRGIEDVMPDDNLANSDLPKGKDPVERPQTSVEEMKKKSKSAMVDDQDKLIPVPKDVQVDGELDGEVPGQNQKGATPNLEDTVPSNVDIQDAEGVKNLTQGDAPPVVLTEEHKIAVRRESGKSVSSIRILKDKDAVVGYDPEEGELVLSASDLSEDGREYVTDLFRKAIAGKVKASLVGVEQVGQIDFVIVSLGDEEFPFRVFLEIHRDENGKAKYINLMDGFLPVEILADLAKFLKSLTKK